MKKNWGLIIILFLIVISLGCIFYFQKRYKEKKLPKIEVILADDLTISFGEQKKISDFVLQFNGEKILDDSIIDYEKIGKKEVSFSYINDENVTVSYQFEVDIKDTTEPFVWLGKTYRVEKDKEVDLISEIQYGDNYDSHPTCEIIGEYDLSKIGDYPLVFKISDSSGNTYEHEFILQVYEPVPNVDTKTEIQYIDYEEIKQNYKKENTKIGIDVSEWQGDIDFEKIVSAGVEFMLIRVGSKNAKGECFLDKKFNQNMELANQYGIPVGVYFYSYAETEQEAKEDAKWVIEQVKEYKIDLPIIFDWEDWEDFNHYRVSFFELTNIADVFLNEIERAGYKGMLYSSKNYLENVWFPTKYDTWLAHYTDKTNYQGDYQYWQMTSNGKINGIEGRVDINIFYSETDS